ncbi:MAG: glutaminyl-peptide cyclotransferase, partial [Pyrinomonadaceae bacterium]
MFSVKSLIGAALIIGLSLMRGAGQSVTNPPVALGSEPADQIPVYSYYVVQSWPHDPRAFTQGLVFHDGYLLESTGRYGDSSVRRVELSSGKVKKRERLDNKFFGEGLTLLGDKLYQLTWTAHKGFIYTLKDFSKQGEFPYEFEGWGLT